MPSIFVRLYLDEDVSVLVGEMIRARGFDVLTTRDAGKLGATDIQQLEFSTREQRVLLTHNRVDFEKLAAQYFEGQFEHSGIVIAVRRLPSEIVFRLLAILNADSAEQMLDQIRYI